MALFGGFSLKTLLVGNEIAMFLLLLGNKIFIFFDRLNRDGNKCFHLAMTMGIFVA